MTSSGDIQKFILGVPQIVPESRCFECRICCRFPDTKEVQIPYWSELEAGWARGKADAKAWFQPASGSPSLEPKLQPCEEAGYRCPAFDAETRRCTIHSVKPLDCRLYPFVLARHPSADQPVLAMDTKCPYIQEHLQDSELSAYASRLTDYLSMPVASAYLETNPKLAGPFWPEYASIASLPVLSRVSVSPEPPPHPALKRWDLGRKEEFLAAVRLKSHDFSGYTAASLWGWSDLMPVWWASLQGALCLFAGRAQGLFMPLPPLAETVTPGILAEAWALLKEANQGGSTSRIEGIESCSLEIFEKAGFTLKQAEPEYLYAVQDLAALQGDRYKSQRGAINRLHKETGGDPVHARPFRSSDIPECLRLYTRWAIRKQAKTEDPYGRALVRDSLFFHRRLMLDAESLGLTGQVAETEKGRLVGYTLGGPISDKLFCVFLEISDPERPGVAQFLFREFCRAQGSTPWINAMGDDGLDGLREAKRGYHPSGFAKVWTATR